MKQAFVQNSSAARGASLLEVLLAAAVLLFALSAMVQLLVLGLERMRNADVQELSQQAVTNTLAEFQAMPFRDIADGGVGVVTLPPFVDEVGRVFTREANVTNVADAGLGALRVDVRVRWNGRAGALTVNRESRAFIIVSEVPDAG